MREKDSVAAYFLQAMVHGSRGNPQHLQAAFEESGVDPAMLLEPTARVPASAFAALWLIQRSELNDEFFGLDSHGMPQGSFALICRGLIQEPDLNKALHQCLGYFSLFLRDFHGTLHVQGERSIIRLNSSARDDDFSRLGEETFLVLITSLLSWLGGRRIPIERADFRQVRPLLSDDSLLWGPNIFFGARCTEIEFFSRYLHQPVAQTPASLKLFLRTSPQWLVIRYRNSHSLASRVQQRLRNSHCRDWPTLDAFAEELGMNSSTFRRKLEREGFSYQEIKDEVRRALAIKLLRKSSMSIGEIAEVIGFQEASAFHRAFKKWIGENPGRYRIQKDHLGSVPG